MAVSYEFEPLNNFMLRIMVDINNLVNMFSQKTGAKSSMATMVINAVIGYMMQRGLDGMMSGGSGGIMSALSNFMGLATIPVLTVTW